MRFYLKEANKRTTNVNIYKNSTFYSILYNTNIICIDFSQQYFRRCLLGSSSSFQNQSNYAISTSCYSFTESFIPQSANQISNSNPTSIISVPISNPSSALRITASQSNFDSKSERIPAVCSNQNASQSHVSSNPGLSSKCSQQPISGFTPIEQCLQPRKQQRFSEDMLNQLEVQLPGRLVVRSAKSAVPLSREQRARSKAQMLSAGDSFCLQLFRASSMEKGTKRQNGQHEPAGLLPPTAQVTEFKNSSN